LPNSPHYSHRELLQADFSSNNFTGKIPSAFIQSDGLVYLNVSRNQLDGIEAAAAWSTPALVTIDMSHNNIAGMVCGIHLQYAMRAHTGRATCTRIFVDEGTSILTVHAHAMWHAVLHFR
jgi:hypothetical protein